MIRQLIINTNSNNIPQIEDKKVDLVIESPPYLMIDMCDKSLDIIVHSIYEVLL